MRNTDTLILMLYIAGAGQVFVALIYEWVRRILEWDADLARMKHVWNRQITNTYSRYIQGLNFAFGLLTLLFAPVFLETNIIVAALALIIGVYWGGRLIVALTYYNTEEITEKKRLFRIGAWAFNLLFGYLAVVYVLVFIVNQWPVTD
ncbi:hypothetical protein [Rubellicoccus peritrichatus]|uniref:MAPEG family protein n=1 Tax=Rubellicoccus peritrichatus TaxID=3080537 RepID=A0AAQ3LDF3_9BACT|nr:hypothetical protein [Puniceicoccus sp. CR14]WOO40024.1 hypothetical protein RZN69_15480 [Puniceicoccus sp. CR14]